jgi:hypothetical protein
MILSTDEGFEYLFRDGHIWIKISDMVHRTYCGKYEALKYIRFNDEPCLVCMGQGND